MASLHEVHQLLSLGQEADALAMLEELTACSSYPPLLVAEAGRLHRRISEGLQITLPLCTPSDAIPSRTPAASSAQKPFRCTVISWDVNHNCLGRAFVIAKLAGTLYKYVELIGFDFNHLGSAVWEPLRDAELCITPLPSPSDAADLFHRADQIARRVDTDLVIACKPRLPSLLLGCLIKHYQNVPLIVDIDDYELGFVANADHRHQFTAMSPLRLRLEAKARLQEKPYSDFWTCYADRLIAFADAKITSNTALAEIYGGLIIPHVRSVDTSSQPVPLEDLLPSPVTGQSPSLVMFLGTPRRHKGVVELADAVASLTRGDVHLVFVGSFTDPTLRRDVEHRGKDSVSFVENIPFARINSYLASARVVVLLQDADSLASAFQLPAKAIDALAVGVQIIATRTKPVEMLVSLGFRGISLLDSLDSLPSILSEALALPLSSADREHNRTLFREHCSYEAGTRVLSDLIQKIRSPGSPNSLLRRPTSFGGLHTLLPPPVGEWLPTQPTLQRNTHPQAKNLHVILWKQNDIGLFGRRVDMVAHYLSSRSDIDHVFIFEKPLSAYDVSELSHKENQHFRLVLQSFHQKRLGLADSDRISVFSPLFPSGLSEDEKDQWMADFVSQVLCNYTSLSSASAPYAIRLWIYPYYPHALAVADGLAPDTVTIDIVDDHTKWPGMTDERARHYQEHYQQLLRIADFSLCNCLSTFETFSPLTHGATFLIPNGVDTSLSLDRSDETFRLKDSLLKQSGAHRIVGYVGNLESKIDWELVVRLADAFPRVLFVYVGSTHMSTELPTRINIHFAGPLPYPAISRYLSLFDVGIVPHLHTDLTVVMNPLKLYVYSCFGFPVVSTNIPNLPEDGAMPQLTIAHTHEEFLNHLHACLENPVISAEVRSQVQCFIHNNSWEARFSKFVDQLHQPLV